MHFCKEEKKCHLILKSKVHNARFPLLFANEALTNEISDLRTSERGKQNFPFKQFYSTRNIRQNGQ